MKASGYARAANDYYIEPRWSIDALLDIEKFDGISCDPACGGGNIPQAMRSRGLVCFASDIVDRGYPDADVEDFLVSAARYDNFVSNPPFNLMRQFIDHALALGANKVVMLGRLAFLEGQERKGWFRLDVPFARLWVSSRRISMPPGGADIPAKNGSEAFGWFVFERGHQGPATIGWL